MSGAFLPDRGPPSMPLTSFVGRETETAALTALLPRPDVRLLTLTGPGGVGKTRLALRVADQVSDGFAGVAVVPLGSVRDGALVAITVARELGVPDAPHPAVTERLQAFLADRPVLLVLDNAEHLLDAVASLVADLLAGCSRLTVLCTSRTPLRISGEQVVPLGALDPGAARELFAVRARAAGSPFVVSSGNAPVIDAICARLDGLPLAIELAAARSPVLSPQALLARLDHRLDLLTDGPRDAAPRHRNLHATIAWSYDLLPEAEQKLFRRLGVFVGGFTLEAAQAVGGGEDDDALRGVTALAAASLVIPVEGVDDEPRFTMLETIREYALERLVESGEEQSIRLAHLRHVVSLGERLWVAPTGRQGYAWLRRLGQEAGNIRSALAWGLGHDPVEAARLVGTVSEHWVINSFLDEGRDWAERALAAAPALPAAIRARVLLTAGWMAKDQDDLIAADAYLTAAATDARAVGDVRALFTALGLLGEVVLAKGEAGRVQDIQAEMQATAETIGEPLTTAVALVNLGRIAAALGDLPRSRAFFEQAVTAHRVSGGTLGVALAQDFLGEVLLEIGDERGAARQFRDAIHGYEGVPAWGQIGISLEGFAAAMARHAPETATRLLAAAGVILERLDFHLNERDIAIHDETTRHVRSVLGDVAFATAWTAGQEMSWDEVLAEVDALATPPDVPDALPPTGRQGSGLTPRELDVLRLLVEGRSNRAIADALSLSERTVENHVQHILGKLGVDSRTAAATWAVRHGIG